VTIAVVDCHQNPGWASRDRVGEVGISLPARQGCTGWWPGVTFFTVVDVIADLFRPWRTAGMARAACYIALDVLFGPIAFSIVITLLATSFGLLITFPLAIPFAWLLFVVSVGLGNIERSRLAALLGLELANPHPALPDTNWFGRLWARAKTPSRWKEIAYLLAKLPVGVFTYVVVVLSWSGSLALLSLPLYVNALPGNSAEFGLFDVGSGMPALVATLLGLVGLVFVSPWLTYGVARLDRAIARGLLGPSESAAHAAEVQRLEARRAAAVDSADSERRRIERNLHDGAQARLVGVAMDLGRAEQHFDEDPERARQLLAGAHDETKAALSELRDLVRGFHPAILEDRGLDAALSAIIARAPVPVDLHVDVSHRPPATVESAAYYVVVEALANIAKHSNATKASVAIARRGDRLAIDVTDDGVGGAEIAKGSGLRGLEERVRGLGGWMQVLSPAGGPTTILVELPCAS
jgi:signal transduction histidine kinase